MYLLPSTLFNNQEAPALLFFVVQFCVVIALFFVVQFCVVIALVFYVDHSWITMRMFCPPLAFHCGCCCQSGMKACYACFINLYVLFLDAQSAPN
jgi:hypothetical protein